MVNLQAMTKKKMKKSKIFMLFFSGVLGYFAFGLSSFAQAPTQDPATAAILEAVGNKYKAYKAVTFTFKRDLQDASGKSQEVMSGELTVSGPKFRLKAADQQVYCDGSTIWTYLIKEKEVTVNNYEPSDDEITPQEIYSLYKKGYKYALAGEVKDGKRVFQIIDLVPEDRKKEISKIRLVVLKKEKTIEKWTVFERGSNQKQVFKITSTIPNPTLPNGFFTFDKANADKGVKVVDMR